MAHAVELFLDPAAEARLRALWAALDAAGAPVLDRYGSPGYRPHVSLGVVDAADPARLAPRLRAAAARAAGLTVRLATLGFFLERGRTIAFLGVAPSEPLLRLHREVDAALQAAASGRRPFYRPGAWTPHCTLPVDAADPAAVAAVVRQFGLLVDARVAGVDLVEVGAAAAAPLRAEP